MVEDEGALSVKDRIAQLKLNQVGRMPEQSLTSFRPSANTAPGAPGALGAKRPPPPPPPRPAVPPRPNVHARSQSTNVPLLQDHVPAIAGNAECAINNLPEASRPNGEPGEVGPNARPALPLRTSTQSAPSPGLPPRKPSGPSPALPPRRPSETPSQPDLRLSRRGSNESVSSVATTRSSVSGISTAASQSDRYSVRAPAYDAASLPPLPPKQTEADKQSYQISSVKSGRLPLKSTYSSPHVGQQLGTTAPPPRRPSVQPPALLPAQTRPVHELQSQNEIAPPPSKNPPSRARRSALEMGLNKPTDAAPSVRPDAGFQVASGAPPPIPVASRPDLAALQASKPKTGGTASPAPTDAMGACLHCRDFSGPDEHAARFPRQTYQDLDQLAKELTAPFSSPTDKSRAIFTWLHHNIAYDTVAFFSHNVKRMTPEKTVQTGLAVCEGYASVFAALALKAGLEAYVLSGHGKGYGYSAIKRGDPLPLYNAGHAWNVVRIDGGTWKLIDPCWGAGSADGNTQEYKKRFAPERFTQTNEEFGLDHFPGDRDKQFRADGRVIEWEEYILGDKRGPGPQVFSGFVSEEGMSRHSFAPLSNPILLSRQGPTVRFSFQKVCQHWDPVQCGKGAHYVYILYLGGPKEAISMRVPFETNGDVWWCDVSSKDLGFSDPKVQICTVTSFDGRDGRGLSIQEYRRKLGKVALCYGGVCMWELA